MYIESIILNNFRVYKDENIITFPRHTDKNIFIISGDNGFGKTTFLTSLIWCLYGKQMGDVDEKFKSEIAESFGYKKFAKSNLNNILLSQSKNFDLSEDTKKVIFKSGYLSSNPRIQEFKKLNEYSVTIIFSNLFIPSVPCEKVTIKRIYDAFRETETTQILIDGKENELTKEVGPEIFINDFILSKDIAKFFFFDSEKIVSLAEMKTVDDRKRLSIAYSEVLGVKKYEDLRNNMENLRIKFRRKSADVADRDKLNKLIKESDDLKKLIEHLKSKQENNDDEIINKRHIAEQYQEKLIREGNSISVSELLSLKALREELKSKDLILKNKLKELLDLAPFAIAGINFIEAYNQMLYEKKHNQENALSINYNKYFKNIKEDIFIKLNQSNISEETRLILMDIIEGSVDKYLIEEDHHMDTHNTLLNFSPNEQNEFRSIYEHIKFSFSQSFKQLVKDDKNNRSFLLKTTRKIIQAESNGNDPLIIDIRTEKSKVEKQILEIEKENRKISEQIGSSQKDLNSKMKLLTELSKKVSLDDNDKQKDEVAERLIIELTDFLLKLKSEKKVSLEVSIRHELNKLMHKKDFINKVQVEIQDEIIDIRLFDKEMQEINKEKLSKGEQQLYATAILKALVDESEIKFPIFIDSPLQKFDKKHAHKIITEFYPQVSEQVVVFPLLEKELTEIEYKSLLPFVRSSYIIRNKSMASFFEEVKPDKLFEKIKEEYVHTS